MILLTDTKDEQPTKAERLKKMQLTNIYGYTNII